MRFPRWVAAAVLYVSVAAFVPRVVDAGKVTFPSMDINDYHTDDNATLMTFKATTTATGALTENDDITITAGSAVFLNGATPGINLIQGFSNCTATSQVSGGGTILTVTLSNSVNATNTSSDSSTGNNISAIVCTVHNSTTFEFSIDSSTGILTTSLLLVCNGIEFKTSIRSVYIE